MIPGKLTSIKMVGKNKVYLTVSTENGTFWGTISGINVYAKLAVGDNCNIILNGVIIMELHA